MIFSNPLLALDYMFFQWEPCNGQLELKIKQVFFCNFAADKPTPNTQTPSSGEILMKSGLNKVSRVQWRVENNTV